MLTSLVTTKVCTVQELIDTVRFIFNLLSHDIKEPKLALKDYFLAHSWFVKEFFSTGVI